MTIKTVTRKSNLPTEEVLNALSPFARELASGLVEAIKYVRGEGPARETLVDVPDPAPKCGPKDVERIRRAFGLTQVKFARIMNVSTTSVEGWESGRRSPGSASLRLLQLFSDIARLSPSSNVLKFLQMNLYYARKGSVRKAMLKAGRKRDRLANPMARASR